MHICFAHWLPRSRGGPAQPDLQEQDFQIMAELGENHTKLCNATLVLLNWGPLVSLSPIQPQPCTHKWRENLHEHFCCQPPKSASQLL